LLLFLFAIIVTLFEFVVLVTMILCLFLSLLFVMWILIMLKRDSCQAIPDRQAAGSFRRGEGDAAAVTTAGLDTVAHGCP